MQYRKDIDGLRAIAVLSVVLFHIQASFLPGGFVGVDIFFVISGFLITTILKNEIEGTGCLNFRNFYLRRIRRILPAFLVTLLLCSIIAIAIFSPSHLNNYGYSLLTALFSVSNFNFWVEADYFDSSALYKPLLHTWSLSIEEQFYIFWPILLIILLKLRPALSTLIIVSLCATSLFSNELFGQGITSISGINFPKPFENGQPTIFFLLPFRIYEFGIGCIIPWLITKQGIGKNQADILFALGFILIGYSIISFSEELLYPGFYGLVPSLGTALMIYSGRESRLSPLTSNNVLVFFGKTSYSLYLIHWPLIVFWYYLVKEPSWIDYIGISLSSIAISYLSYKYIEQPFRTNSNITNKAFLKLLAILFILLTFLGGIIVLGKGWSWRISSDINFENSSTITNFHKEYYGGANYPSYIESNSAEPAEIVLLGDSHGQHYADGLYRVIAKPNEYSIYFAAGTSCFHLPGFTRTTKGHDWDKICPERLNTALKHIESGNTPIVIISHSWLAQKKKAGHLTNRDKAISVEDILQGISQLKAKIGSSPLIVIGQVPGSNGMNLYDILSRPTYSFIWSGKDNNDSLFMKRNQEAQVFNEKLANYSNTSGEFIFLDPHDAFCEGDTCRNIDKKKRLIYSDSAHLSVYGSRYMISHFKETILSTIESRKNSE